MQKNRLIKSTSFPYKKSQQNRNSSAFLLLDKKNLSKFYANSILNGDQKNVLCRQDREQETYSSLHQRYKLVVARPEKEA